MTEERRRPRDTGRTQGDTGGHRGVHPSIAEHQVLRLPRKSHRQSGGDQGTPEGRRPLGTAPSKSHACQRLQRLQHLQRFQRLQRLQRLQRASASSAFSAFSVSSAFSAFSAFSASSASSAYLSCIKMGKHITVAANCQIASNCPSYGRPPLFEIFQFLPPHPPLKGGDIFIKAQGE